MVQWDTQGWGGDAAAWYCQKRIRPLLRGYSHAAACILSPLYAAERLAVAKTDSVATAVVLETAAQMMLFGASYAYHRGDWDMWSEAFAARVDYVGESSPLPCTLG
jgi:predicted membrane channel-forming protein YqfA (hemolysin III family)